MHSSATLAPSWQQLCRFLDAKKPAPPPCLRLQVLEAEASELGDGVLVSAACYICCFRPQPHPAGSTTLCSAGLAFMHVRLVCFCWCMLSPTPCPIHPHTNATQPKELRGELVRLMTSPELMVEFTLRLLGLEGCADTVVGDAMIR